MSKHSTTWVILPGHWDDQHRQLYDDYSYKHPLDLLPELLRYKNAKNDPKLKNYPEDMVKKTVEVITFILEEVRGLDIDLLIEHLKEEGLI